MQISQNQIYIQAMGSIWPTADIRIRDFLFLLALLDEPVIREIIMHSEQIYVFPPLRVTRAFKLLGCLQTREKLLLELHAEKMRNDDRLPEIYELGTSSFWESVYPSKFFYTKY